MQTRQMRLSDKTYDKWYETPKSLEEANIIIVEMRAFIEKTLTTQDKVVTKLDKIDYTDTSKIKEEVKEVKTVLSELKTNTKVKSKKALFVLAHFDDGTTSRKKLTNDLSKKNEFEKQAKLGVKEIIIHSTRYSTQFINNNRNWSSEPKTLEIIEDNE